MGCKAVDYRKNIAFDVKNKARLASYVLDMVWQTEPEMPSWRHLRKLLQMTLEIDLKLVFQCKEFFCRCWLEFDLHLKARPPSLL